MQAGCAVLLKLVSVSHRLCIGMAPANPIATRLQRYNEPNLDMPAKSEAKALRGAARPTEA